MARSFQMRPPRRAPRALDGRMYEELPVESKEVRDRGDGRFLMVGSPIDAAGRD